ncbi:MAG: sulfotransferase [Tahibacter sp.]
MQIFVCGMHRSGTSMIARLLNLMGIYFGPEGSALPANRENPKGFWERRDIVQLNDAVLNSTGSTWFDVYKFMSRPPNWQLPDSLAPRVATKLGDIDAYRPWFLKDPRFCLTLPYWLQFCERPLAIVCSRDPASIIESLAKRSEITGLVFTLEESLALWEYHGSNLLLSVSGMPTVFVRYERMLAAPVEACARLYQSLREHKVGGIRMPEPDEILAFVDSALHRSAPAQAPSAEFVQWVERLDRCLDGGADADIPLSTKSIRALAGLNERLEGARRRHDLLQGLAQQRAHIEALLTDAGASDPTSGWTASELSEFASRRQS